MTIPQRSLLIVAGCTAALTFVRLFESETARYTFGHPRAMDIATMMLLLGLFATHAAIALIMWLQRSYWLPSDAAMFRFISVKALLWINAATLYMSLGRGVRLDIVVLYTMIALTTLDLDVRMVRRYWFATKDEREDQRGEAWDGETERRGDQLGRRAYDQQRGRS